MDPGMDFCVLICLQLVFADLHVLRLLGAQLMMTLAALTCQAMNASLPLQALMMVPGAAMLTREQRPERILQTALCMLALSAAGAGFHMLGGRIAGFAGVAALGFLLRRQRHLRFQWNIRLQMDLDGITECFPALIDTGNRLRDPVNRDPVLIVQADAVPMIAAHIKEMDPGRLRPVPFGVLGGSGEIFSFRPDQVRILQPGRQSIEAPACRAAVFHGRIPGRIRALAPPEFADTMAREATLQGISHRARRVIHGFFKCKAIHLRAGSADTQGFGVLHRRQ